MTMSTKTGSHVYKKEYLLEQLPKIDYEEIWRYAGYDGVPSDKHLVQLLEELIKMSNGHLNFKLLYTNTNKSLFDIESNNLNKLLAACDKICIFAATIGFWIDSQIQKFAKSSAIKSLLYHSFGTERIEALCNKFCEDFEFMYPDKNITMRCSPGYGDFSLSVQKKIFEILNCEKLLGLSLNESMLISPSKSVTAVFGISDLATSNINTKLCKNKCEYCSKIDCEFRKV